MNASAAPPCPNPLPRRIMMLGGSGTIGQATVRALIGRGHDVVCFLRRPPPSGALPDGVELRYGDVTSAKSWRADCFCGDRFDALVSCLASRTGAPHDAQAIDHDAHVHALEAAIEAGVAQMVLLSAICVQQPELAFQRAKLAFEARLVGSGIAYSIVRPTAFFKSLVGQVDRVTRGKPFVIFADGRQTACKPISDRDLADFLVECLENPALANRILPIGGPGPAITPRQQGEMLFSLLGRPARFVSVPIGLLDAIIGVLDAAGRVVPAARAKAELARIGRYYATHSMLVLDPASGRYDARNTPEFGRDTLFDLYARLIKGEAAPDRGEHAVF